jgi:hypothetical protein
MHGCSFSKYKDVECEFIRVANKSTNDTVYFNMTDVVNCNFDSYSFIPPYTTTENTSIIANINPVELSKTGIADRDDIYVLCLFKNKSMVNLFKISRKHVQISKHLFFKRMRFNSDLLLIKQTKR